MDLGFGAHLARLIRERDTSQRAFARGVGLRQAALYAIIHRGAKPPKKHIDAMARLLKLQGEPLRCFLDMAWLEHAPEYVRHRVAELERRLLSYEDGRKRTRTRSR